MKKVLLFLFIIPQLSYSQSNSEEKKLNQLFEKIENYENRFDAMGMIYQGKHPNIGFEKINEETYQKTGEEIARFISQLEEIKGEQLERQAYINKEIMLMHLKDRVSDIQYKMYLIPFNAEGGFYNRMSRSVARLPFKTAEDYEAYLQWLPSYANHLKDYRELLELGIKEGIIAPKVIVNNTLKLLTPWNNTDPTKSPFYAPFNEIPNDFSEEIKTNLQEKGKEVIKNSTTAFYTDFTKFLETEYMNAAPQKPGVGLLPKGKKYCEDRVRFYTTFNITPDSVHRLGLEEVARIKKQMETVIQEVEFEGFFADFLAFLRTDEQFYAKTLQEILNHAAWLSKRAEAGLPQLFNSLYLLPFTVAPVPAELI